LAAKDASQLIRYEIDLAKAELSADMRRVGLAGALVGFAAFVGCLVLVMLSFAFAFGLVRDQWNPFGLRDRGFFLMTILHPDRAR